MLRPIVIMSRSYESGPPAATVILARLVLLRVRIDGRQMSAPSPLSLQDSPRSRAIAYDEEVYKERNLVERFFNKIKHFRRIATRYEKTALSFSAMLALVGVMIWLR